MGIFWPKSVLFTKKVQPYVTRENVGKVRTNLVPFSQSLVSVDISAVLSWFRSFLWVFHGFPLCFRCFLTVFCGFRCMQGNQSRSFIPIPLFQWNFPLFFTVFGPFSGYFAVFLRVLGVIQCVLDVFCGFPMYFDRYCCRQSPRVHAARARSQKTPPILSPTHPNLVY